ncbi:rod shape-determining protein MreC [Thiohalophilus sp.]|uniref:rod shape-determining protein MreC n=1 Tax=Thiohalophilus sp. TaxID=3028392 RepID=UPI00397555D8
MTVKLLFVQGPSTTIRLLLLILISVTLMTVDHRTSYINTLRSGLSVVVYPLQYAVNLPADFVDWASQTFVTRNTLLTENEELRTQNRLLKSQLQKLTFIESENVHLRELLQSSKRAGERILIAELLAVDLDPYRKQVVINKGSTHDELYIGQPVVDAHGVMGKLTHVTPFSSTALLITDPNHAVPVQVNRNGLRAVAVGSGEGTVELLHLPNNADIQEGDLLVSSGLGCVYPAGYPVATVTEVTTNPRLPFAEIVAEPVARLQRSREVLLVWPALANLPPMENPCEVHKRRDEQ